MTELHVLGPDDKALKREKIVDVLWALQKQRGYIDDDAVRLAGKECDLTPAEVDEVATFYNLLLRRPAGRRQIFLCDSISCELRGAPALIAEVEKQLGAKLGEITADGEFGLLPIVCLGHCEKAPCLLANEQVYGPLATDASSVAGLLQRIRMNEVLLRAKGKGGRPASIDEYRATGGYSILARTLNDLSSDDLIQKIKDSGLRGRGGAGFPSGMKWSFVARGDKADGGPKYLMCNCDEMEPGTFKDRVILEVNPHALIEGMILAAHGMEMTEGFVFVRREYFRQTDDLETALQEARDAGMLGRNIGGSRFSFDIHVHRSGGRYICGEETALLNAFEGRKAQPRSKPPFPAVRGLWGRPTTVHNVETLACVPGIVEHGPEWFKKLAANPEGAGTKLYGGSGSVERPMCIERPIGTTLRQLLDEMGGVRGGKQLLGVIPGGASTAFMTPEHLDVPMDYAPLEKIGTRLGTGTFIVFSEHDCPLKGTLNLQRFFARESCGFCTPCRDGLPYGVWLLDKLERGEGSIADIDRVDELYHYIGPNSFCAHAAGAAEPIKGLIKHFRPILEQHVTAKGCPFAKRAEVAYA